MSPSPSIPNPTSSPPTKSSPTPSPLISPSNSCAPSSHSRSPQQTIRQASELRSDPARANFPIACGTESLRFHVRHPRTIGQKFQLPRSHLQLRSQRQGRHTPLLPLQSQRRRRASKLAQAVRPGSNHQNNPQPRRGGTLAVCIQPDFENYRRGIFSPLRSLYRRSVSAPCTPQTTRRAGLRSGVSLRRSSQYGNSRAAARPAQNSPSSRSAGPLQSRTARPFQNASRRRHRPSSDRPIAPAHPAASRQTTPD